MILPEIRYIVRCNSHYASLKTREALETAIRSDAVITRTFWTLPGGIERREIRSFRIGDYFDYITINSIDQLRFNLTFQVSDKADRFWKDLVVAIIQSITDNQPEVSVIPVPPSR